jgi:hypothetical protein
MGRSLAHPLVSSGRISRSTRPSTPYSGHVADGLMDLIRRVQKIYIRAVVYLVPQELSVALNPDGMIRDSNVRTALQVGSPLTLAFPSHSSPLPTSHWHHPCHRFFKHAHLCNSCLSCFYRKTCLVATWGPLLVFRLVLKNKFEGHSSLGLRRVQPCFYRFYWFQNS